MIATLRLAHARLRRARELEQSWEELPDEEKEPVRHEWNRLKAAIAALEGRLTYGARGFVREFRAASRGRDAPETAEPQPLGEAIEELGEAITAFRSALDRVPEGPEADRPPGGPSVGRGPHRVQE